MPPKTKRCPHGTAAEKVKSALKKRPVSTFAQLAADLTGKVSAPCLRNNLKSLAAIGEVESPAWGFYRLASRPGDPLTVLRATDPLKYAVCGYIVKSRKPLTAEQIRHGLWRDHRLEVVESTLYRHIRQMFKRRMLFRVPHGMGALQVETPWFGYWREAIEAGEFHVPRKAAADAPWVKTAKPAKPAAPLDPDLADLLS